MTVTMIGTGTIMIVIMIAIAPCTTPKKMIPLGHPIPITETGTNPPTEIESIILPVRSHRSREPDDTSQTTVICIVTEGDKHILQGIHPTPETLDDLDDAFDTVTDPKF